MPPLLTLVSWLVFFGLRKISGQVGHNQVIVPLKESKNLEVFKRITMNCPEEPQGKSGEGGGRGKRYEGLVPGAETTKMGEEETQQNVCEVSP